MTGNLVAVGNVEIGEHIVWKIGGLSFNVDTILATLIASAVLIFFGLWVRTKLTSGVPKGPQLAFETATGAVERQVEATLGIRTAPFVVPLAIVLFFFILFANWIAVFPTGHHPEYVPPPASDVNLTYALALLVIVWMHVTGVRKRGFRGYYRHLAQPYWWLFPINLIEEIARPITLALRLFGNIFSGVSVVSLIALFPAYILWAPNAVWKLFDLFIAVIQAFIFALLTILYFGSVAPSQEGGH